MTKEPQQELSKHDQMLKLLSENPEVVAKQRIGFERAFGVDQKTRNQKQWKNLVRVYGAAQVAELESMTIAEVLMYCKESPLRRQLRLMKENS